MEIVVVMLRTFDLLGARAQPCVRPPGPVRGAAGWRPASLAAWVTAEWGTNLCRVYGRVERPFWLVRSPRGEQLRVEFDVILNRWRISPGEYTRRELPAALAQATGSSPDAAWIVELHARLQA